MGLVVARANQSDAWRTAPILTRRVIERIAVEHMNHGGTENGRLAVTYTNFVEWGISRRLISKALADAIARGLIYRTERGVRSAGDQRRPSRYGLGWLPGHDASASRNRWRAWAPASSGKGRAPPTLSPPKIYRVVPHGGTGEPDPKLRKNGSLVPNGGTGEWSKVEPGKKILWAGSKPTNQTGEAIQAPLQSSKPQG